MLQSRRFPFPQTRTLRIDEIEIGPSTWVGKNIGEVELRERFGLLLLAVKDASGNTYWVNPPDNLALREGTVLIVMGRRGIVRKARSEAQHRLGRAMATAR